MSRVAAETVEQVRSLGDRYKYGFVTDIESEQAPKGLNEDIVRFISAIKDEPEWLLEWRLEAFRHWQTMTEPNWAKLGIPMIDYQDAYYYSAPKQKEGPKSLDEVDPELLATYDKLGIPLREQEMLAGVAVDAVFDSVSVATTFKAKLEEHGASSSARSPRRCRTTRSWCGSTWVRWCRYTDNFFATLNSAVFTDGSFVYIPKGVRCPMELSTYFRINAANTGQFERTLIIAEDSSYVSYLEGCTAPMRDENQLHAAVVELVALDDAEIKYSTVQNWYPGDENGVGGIFNFVTKRGACIGARSKILDAGRDRLCDHLEVPELHPARADSVGEFYSVAITNNCQQADTGTKMIHMGPRTRSHHRSPRASRRAAPATPIAAWSRCCKRSDGARNYTQCDSLLIGDRNAARTPSPTSRARTARPASSTRPRPRRSTTTSFSTAASAASSEEDAVALIVNGFCREVLQQLPMEFAVEAQKLVGISLEGSVG